ncbi:MAG TPA: hypothetical protein VIJ40_00090 [Acidimicrobiales bacterium]
MVFGLITLLSIPLYYAWPVHLSDMHCHYYANGSSTCSGTIFSHSGLLTPGFSTNQLGNWLSLFWVASMFLGYLATIAFYRHRAVTVGLKVRIWPAVAVGLGLLIFVMLMQAYWHTVEPSFLNSGDFWARGTATLVILSVGIVTLAVLERSFLYLIYALGFVFIALVSTLYNVSNLVQWEGLGRFITPRNEMIPNVILSSLYLLIGGFVFWALQHDARVTDDAVGIVEE